MPVLGFLVALAAPCIARLAENATTSAIRPLSEDFQGAWKSRRLAVYEKKKKKKHPDPLLAAVGLPGDWTPDRKTPPVGTKALDNKYWKHKIPGEILHNGIVLPKVWPPQHVTFDDLILKRPPKPPYLKRPPKVINVDVGRQLFVDDFLVDHTSGGFGGVDGGGQGAVRTFHRAVDLGIVLEPMPDESQDQVPKFYSGPVGFAKVATSRPFSGGIWYDEAKARFIMHYRCGYIYSGYGRQCVAFSKDGIHWERPDIVKSQFKDKQTELAKAPGPKPKNLLRLPFSESFTTWLDADETDPRYRFKAVVRARATIAAMTIHASADGVDWEPLPNRAKTGIVTDRASIYYDPFRRLWVFSIRENLCKGGHGHLRISRYKEVPSLSAADWPVWVKPGKSYFQCVRPKTEEPVTWIGVDALDCEGDNVTECDLYHVDATPYESLFVAQLAVLYPGFAHGGCKTSKVHAGFSRDGFHFSRVQPEPGKGGRGRLPLVDDPHGLNYQQPIAGNFVVKGDEIYVYYAGATHCRRCNDPAFEYCTEGDRKRDGNVKPTESSMKEVTALAVLRRDGFASLSPPLDLAGRASSPVRVVTRPLTFTKDARHLFVNADLAGADGAGRSELTVAVLGPNFEEITALSLGRAACKPLSGVNATKILVEWEGRPDLGPLRHRPFRLAFHLKGPARLYSFWVSPTPEGEAGGFVNGGVGKLR
eukprot:CAMPEP_0172631360 /NCGR_PEP_ID=MMETSP1068-20121228/178736_1 /TAXON_ID=35684 /ORGANISM="Pseudopedinella elastica, Strain CCMP716" /LENGTH=703 /DNA_ID=CAMNT_0013442479 /DNA_START=99 /DNA_END=2210 /DNA_ORIENTATION=-